ncbi:hypothetical protein NQ176_g9870 [Zarea fungicola]|uniref:Uncharacterized protein n=1 Tax=Zarea fungicola TaxID=93591 RepID=A0ACC1MJB4_9HYPO|nr:hypothetical protein NQ176_g9870 [Lecanicillium fungicola]
MQFTSLAVLFFAANGMSPSTMAAAARSDCPTNLETGEGNGCVDFAAACPAGTSRGFRFCPSVNGRSQKCCLPDQ